MKKIKLIQLKIENFKGCKNETYNFDDNTAIYGANATGKTTIVDSFFWILFNKDSQGNTKFQIRPLDKEGNTINNVEIKVEATLEIDGKSLVLTKKQKQNWVKKRGSSTEELQGNVNKYELNNFPVSEKEYKQRISEIVNEELFKLITNPTAFTSLEWKKQREILFQLVKNITDIDIAETDKENFGIFIENFRDGVTLDQMNKKAKTTMNELKKEANEIPVRIDELSKQFSDIDVIGLEKRKQKLIEEIEISEKERTDIYNKFKILQEKKDYVFNMKMELSELKREVSEKLIKGKMELESKKEEQKIHFNNIEQVKKSFIKQRIKELKELKETTTNKREEIFQEYKEKAKMTFDENKLICPMCKQDLPESEQEQIKADFEREKQKELDRLIRIATECKKKLEELDKEEKEQEDRLEELGVEQNILTKQIKELEKDIEDISEKIKEAKENADYREKEKEVEQLEKEIEDTTIIKYRSDIDDKIRKLTLELVSIEQLLTSNNNEQLKERISELEEKQIEVAQAIADQEKTLYLLEKFTRKKMDLLSEKINNSFQKAEFKFYNEQLNGGYQETCECKYNGVPISSLNQGHKLILGLDIITTLQKIYDINCPVFLDNAECINLYNLPKTDFQTISLYVSDDDEIKFLRR